MGSVLLFGGEEYLMDHGSDWTAGFMPHGHCYLWRPDVLWLHVISDAMIIAAYLAIPITLLVALRRIKNLPYRWIFVMFSAFIFFCGMTHVVNIVAIWKPVYYLQGYVKAITGAVSVTTAVLFVPILPRALAALIREFADEDRGHEN